MDHWSISFQTWRLADFFLRKVPARVSSHDVSTKLCRRSSLKLPSNRGYLWVNSCGRTPHLTKKGSLSNPKWPNSSGYFRWLKILIRGNLMQPMMDSSHKIIDLFSLQEGETPPISPSFSFWDCYRFTGVRNPPGTRYAVPVSAQPGSYHSESRECSDEDPPLMQVLCFRLPVLKRKL